MKSQRTINYYYDVAIKLLRDRFENQRLIINNHVKNIVNIQSISKESHVALRKLVDSVQKDLKALNSLKEPVDQWDTLLIFLLSAKVDSVTRREWEIDSLRRDITDFDGSLQFLKDKCQILETIQSSVVNKIEIKNPIQGHFIDKSKQKSHSFVASFKSSFSNAENF